jgi:hypothetical protein
MIAGEADALESRRRGRDQMIQHLGRRRPAVDIVAQHDDELPAWEFPAVLDDGAFERQQLVEAAVHVAHGIDRRVREVELQARPPFPPAFAETEEPGQCLQ